MKKTRNPGEPSPYFPIYASNSPNSSHPNPVNQIPVPPRDTSLPENALKQDPLPPGGVSFLIHQPPNDLVNTPRRMPRSVSLEKGESTYSNDGIAPKSKSNTFFGMNEEGKGEQSEGSVKVETQANKKLVSPLNQTEVEAMRKALERGVLPVKRMKIVLVGEGRAGKTSLLRALRDLEFRKDEESTVYVNPVEVEQHFLENWEEGKKYGQLLKSVQSSLGISTPKRRSSGISKLAKQVPRLFPTAVSSQPNSSNDDFVSLHKQKYPVSRSESKSIVKRLEDMHISSKSAQYPTKDDFNSTTMTIYDFAGQNRYSVFQQIFITAQAIYLVIFRLDSMFLRDGNGLNQSELRVVLSWLNTIQLRVPESKIFLIATQCDKSQSYNLPLLESFIPSTIKQLIVPNEQAGVRDSLIFVTSAKTKKGIKDLREAIDKVVQQCVSELEQKPVDWIQFQDKIADLILEKKTPLTYRMEEMMKIAHEFRITDRKELDAVLRYFHNIGVVLYFPKNSQLRRVVFPNPQAVVNVVSEVFRYHDNPSSIREVSRHNLQALEELITNKVWMRSLLDELWGKHLSTNEVASLFALLKEFDLLCDIKPLTLDSKTTNIAHNTISVMPYLVLCFPDDVLPAGLYHQLAVRFAANSPRGYIPKVYRHCALVSLPQNELIIQEEFMYGIIRIQLIVKSESMRSEFANAWMYISAIIAGVISEHWSKRWVYRIVPVCPHLTLRPQQQQIPHGIKNILLYGQKSPSHKVFCDHSSHKLTNEEVDIGFLSRFWFTEQVIVNTNMDENLSSTNLLTGPQSGIEDGFGTIMLSYSWGKKDLMTGLYLNQEAVKKIASALETRGFKVWLDVCYMKGNMVTKMMNVIANCDAVISCVTNEYHIETSNSYREFMCAWYRKKKIFGIKLAKDADMAGGAYGFYKGYGDKFYSLADCDSEKAYELILDELARDISSTLEL